MERTFLGYKRPHGRAGVRNILAIIPSVFCANTTVEKIASLVPGAVPMTHAVGCAQVGWDLELTARTLKATACNPNVGGVVVVGLGCERFNPQELYDAVCASGKPAAKFVIQDEGTSATIQHAAAAAREIKTELDRMARTECPVSDLMIAAKCGGTDATSGLAANPVVGNMLDRLIADGGSGIFSECNELLGTEDYLAGRAVDKEVAKKVYEAIYGIEDVLRNGLDFTLAENRNHLISRGNFDGGVSSIVEKAMGGVLKSGNSPIIDVLEYSTPATLTPKGLYLMNYESHDGEVVTGMIGCGAQMVAFTTGRGNPTGHPAAPVLKVTGNEKTFGRMTENFDFDASPIISKGESIESLGEKLYNQVIAIASGEPAKAELFGGRELFCVGRRHGCKRMTEEEIWAEHKLPCE